MHSILFFFFYNKPQRIAEFNDKNKQFVGSKVEINIMNNITL